ncbi:MAG TPA: hypothetical protein ENI87_14955, partial [bacterium]|nr:hypothetical protein [bacterium]
LLVVSMVGDDPAVDPFQVSREVVALARRRLPPTLAMHAAGLPLVEGSIAELVAGERTTIVPLLLAVLLGVAWSLYRSLWLATAVVLPAVVAIAWTGGVVAWLGHPLDPVAALLDPVLLTIGVAASVHFVEGFLRGRADALSTAAALAAAKERLRRPAFWATTTTMLGLLSLTANDTPAVADFGLRAALGVALTHLFTFRLLPAYLARVAGAPVPAIAAGALRSGATWVGRLRATRPVTLALAAAAIALAAAGLPRIETGNDPLLLLPEDHVVRRDYDVLAARLGGVETCHLLIDHDSSATAPERLLPFLAEVRVGEVTAGLAGPVRRGVEGDLAVPLLLRPSGSTTRARCFAAIERSARVLGLDGVIVAGRSVRIARDSVALIRGLLRSLSLSLVVLTVAMAIALRSWRLGLAAMVPSVLPSLWLYGGLGCLVRPLSVATAMIGCTMLGLIVDNTLHLLHHLKDARASGCDAATALIRAFDRCGRAIALSTVVLMAGFLTATCSRLSTTVEFGLLASVTIAMAWFGTAVLLPTVLLRDRAPAEGGDGAR